MPDPILVVDDNSMNLKLAGDVLESEGFRVSRVMNAEDAILSIRVSPPALILMDISLPGMDGLTLTRLLKADAATREIVIVALTAFAMKGDEDKIRAAGCDGYISKPIDTRQLPVQVAGYLEAKAKKKERP